MAIKDTQLDMFNKLINLAGRQRMLSQRIGFFLLKCRLSMLQDCAMDAKDLANLQQSLSQFKETHALLNEGRFSAGSQPLTFQPIKHSQAPESLAAIEHFQALACAISDQAQEHVPIDGKALDQLIEDIPNSILAGLQAIVDSLQAECETRSHQETCSLSQSIEEARLAIDRIETAARYSKMVSLNARVAAGRAGAKGAEFSALSTELKTVANNIQEAADDVRNYLTQIA